MQNQFYNQPAVDWAKQNLKNPVPIRLAQSGFGKVFVYFLLFFPPSAFIIYGIITGFFGFAYKNDPSGSKIIVCGLVQMIPAGIVVLIVLLTHAKFAEVLETDGVKYAAGKLVWGKLYYVDHISRVIGRRKVIKNNQIELVFENGKVIIPPMIHNSQQSWALINSIPVEVRDDGVIRKSQYQ